MQRLLNLHPALLDIGAESTRPGATPLTSDEEWARLEPLLCHWKELKSSYPFTQLSLDTRHPQTAEKALAYDVSVLNDVGGLASVQMQDVAAHFDTTILMHSLSVPADPRNVLPKDQMATSELKSWLDTKLSDLPQNLLEKLIFDPGIGFGKTPLQSLELLQNLDEFKSYDLPLLVGHSRKSFMNLWCGKTFSNRDLETLGVSAQLFSQVEYLRIHNLDAHQRLQKSQLALTGAL
jgi:dihydropteroate synthase